MAEYTLKVRIDKESLISDYLSAMKAVKDKADSDNQISKFKIVADEKTFFDSVKKMLSNTSILEKDIRIGIDTDYYKNSLEKLNGYTDKTVTQIKNSLGRGFVDTEKYDLNKVITGNLSKNKVKSKIQELTSDIKTSMQNIDIGDYKQLDSLLEKVKQLQSITTQISAKGKHSNYKDIWDNSLSKNEVDNLISEIKNQYSKAIVMNREQYISQMNSEMQNEMDSVQKLFSKLLNTLFDETGKLRENLSSSIASGVQQGVDDSKSALNDLKKQLNEVDAEIDRLNNKKVNNTADKEKYYKAYDEFFNKYEDDESDFSQKDIDAYVNATREYISTLEKSSDEYKNVVADYKEVINALGSEGDGGQLPLIGQMTTYTDLINEAKVNQIQLNNQIEEQQKLINEINKTDKISPAQQFDNVIQQDLVYLENYKNTITEINKLKIAPQTDEIKQKMEELQKLANYFFGNISVTQNQLGNDGGNFANDPYSTYRNRLSIQGYGDKAYEIFKIGNQIKSNLDIDNLTSSFSGISEELERIESRSESLRQSLGKDLTESIQYVKQLKDGVDTLAESYEILHDPSYAKDTSYLNAAKKDIESILSKFPELEQFKNRFTSEEQALEFVKTDEWKNFLATLPQAKAYLESIGYDFEKMGQSNVSTNVETATQNTEKLEQEAQAAREVTEAINEKQNVEKQDSTDTNNVEEEIQKLETLKTKINEVKQAIKDKTQEFENEASSVDTFVNSELTSLKKLFDELGKIEQKIKDTIDALKNSDKTDIILTPKLSTDYESEIQELLKGKYFKIKLSPELTTNFVKAAQSKLDEAGGIKIKSYEEEKALNSAVQDYIEKITGGAKLSKKTIEELNSEIKNTITLIQTGGKSDASGIVDILSGDEKYLKQTLNDIWNQYENVRINVSKSKIKIDSSYIKEFGDEWESMRGKIGLNVLSQSEGVDPQTALKEISSAAQVVFEEVNNDYEAIRVLYEYLNNPPDLKHYFLNRVSSNDNEELEWYENELTTIANSIDKQKLYYQKNLNDYNEYISNLKQKISEEEQLYDSRSQIYSNNALATNNLSQIYQKNIDDYDSYLSSLKQKISEEQQLFEQRANQIVDTGGINNTIDNLSKALVDIISDIEQIQRVKLKPQVDDSEIKKLVSNFQNKYGFIPPEIMDDAAWDTIIRNTDYISKNLSSINNVDVSWFRELISNNGLFDTSKVEKYVQEYNMAQSLINEHATTIANSSAATEQLAEAENQEAQAAQAAAENEKMLAKAREEVTQSSTQLPAIIPLVDNQAIATEAFYKDIGKNNNLYTDGNAGKNAELIKYEASAMNDLKSSSEEAAESKDKFATANGVVLASIVKSLAGLNSEGNAFEYINKIINKLANNNKMKNLVSNLTKIRDILSESTDSDAFINSIRDIANQGDNLKDLVVVLKSTKAQIENAKSAASSSSTSTSDNEVSNVERAIQLYNQLYDAQIKRSKIKIETDEPAYQHLTEVIDQTTQAIDNLNLSQEEVTQVSAAVADKQLEAANAVYKANAKATESTEKLQKSAENLKTTVVKQASAMKNNGKLMNEFGDQVNEALNKAESINTSINPKEAISQLQKLRNELLNISSAAEKAGKSGKTLGQMFSTRFKSLISYIGTFTSFYRVVSYIRSAFSTLKDLDTQLVDLRKTTTMTTSELNEFYKSSSNVAKQMGVTTSEIISQASAWSRLGYSSKEASTEMAKLSSQFASISPGMDTNSATDALVSTMQAYGIKVDEVQRKIMDNVNAIGNSMATTNQEIGDMLQRSSAAMKAANNTLEETIALESSAVQITRNAETTGTAFRTISMRIRGKQSLPPYGESYTLCA